MHDGHRTTKQSSNICGHRIEGRGHGRPRGVGQGSCSGVWGKTVSFAPPAVSRPQGNFFCRVLPRTLCTGETQECQTAVFASVVAFVNSIDKKNSCLYIPTTHEIRFAPPLLDTSFLLSATSRAALTSWVKVCGRLGGCQTARRRCAVCNVRKVLRDLW